MNKDFMLLNDNTIEVTNEIGIENNRGKFENQNVKDILLAENKIEIVEVLEEEIEKSNTENKKTIFLSKAMLKFSTILLILSPVIGFTCGAISHPADFEIYGIAYGLYWLGSAIIPIAFVKIYFNVIKLMFKKKTRDIEKILSKTNTMKKEYEEELQIEKEKVNNNTLEPLVKVSLEEESITIANQIAEELKNYYQENIKQKGKIKIRKI